ncbi:hypothetical protein GCM10010496_39360 [Streptomyces asoensis]|nr:hypothetical protein GCM10010496_39360 [Streptomyces asoensis]
MPALPAGPGGCGGDGSDGGACGAEGVRRQPGFLGRSGIGLPPARTCVRLPATGSATARGARIPWIAWIT